MEHTNLKDTNLKQDNDEPETVSDVIADMIAPKFPPQNTPEYIEQLHQESVQWFTRFVDEFARIGGQPKYSVQDTMQIAVATSARMIAFPLTAMRLKDGSPLPPFVEEVLITGYLAKLETYLYDILAKRDAMMADKRMKEGTGI